MTALKISYVYAYHVTSHDLVKVGYGDNPRVRLAAYCAAYNVTADLDSLRIWDFQAPTIASFVESFVHAALIEAGFDQYCLSSYGKEAQELFELGSSSYDDAIIIIAEAVECAARDLSKGLKGKNKAGEFERNKQRGELIRREKAEDKRRLEEIHKASEQSQREAMAARAKASWDDEVQPWLNAKRRATALMKTKSPMTNVISMLCQRTPDDELRRRDIYPDMLMLIEEIFHLTRRARAWRLRLVLEFGFGVKPEGIDLQFPGGFYLPDDSLHDHIDEESVNEVRLAVQSATGWGGDTAMSLIQRDPSAFQKLICFAKYTPSPERATGKTWCKYTTKGKYAR